LESGHDNNQKLKRNDFKMDFNPLDWTCLIDVRKRIPRCRWEGNIKRYLIEINCMNVCGI
jgi:hypothetical protein